MRAFFFITYQNFLLMKKLVFALLILSLASCGDNGDDPRMVLKKSVHTNALCEQTDYKFCRMGVDSTGTLTGYHKADNLIFSFPKTSENEK